MKLDTTTTEHIFDLSVGYLKPVTDYLCCALLLLFWCVLALFRTNVERVV